MTVGSDCLPVKAPTQTVFIVEILAILHIVFATTPGYYLTRPVCIVRLSLLAYWSLLRHCVRSATISTAVSCEPRRRYHGKWAYMRVKRKPPIMGLHICFCAVSSLQRDLSLVDLFQCHSAGKPEYKGKVPD
jgi:hypothetical protein